MTVLFAALLVLAALVFFGSFLYFAQKHPHALRSEAFELKVTELIERRNGEMRAGIYEEVSALSEWKAQTSPTPITEGRKSDEQ